MRASGQPRQTWGWHPLRDEWADRIVADAAIRRGELTHGGAAPVLPRRPPGARVIAVELHARRAEALRQRFGGSLTVLECDARRLRLPFQPFRVVASPPYGVSSALLHLLLQQRSSLIAADLVLQRAVVRRFAGGDVGRTYRHWQLSSGRPLPRTAFHPPPRVDSRVLLIRRRPRS